jgi:hypothetical protein
VEIAFGLALAVLVLSLVAIFRRERHRRESGEESPTHPFLIGVYRGLAVVVIAYVALVLIVGILGRPG